MTISKSRVMCPEDVAALACDVTADIIAEFEKLDELFRSKYPIAADLTEMEILTQTASMAHLVGNNYTQDLQNTIGRIIARDVMVVPILPNSNPWDGREDIAHAVARFGLLIKDLANRFPMLLDEDRHEALVFLIARSEELRTLLQSFVVLTSDSYGCRMLDASVKELRGLIEWVESASELEVRKRLIATQESILAWSRQELKHLDSIAHAGNIHGQILGH